MLATNPIGTGRRPSLRAAAALALASLIILTSAVPHTAAAANPAPVATAASARTTSDRTLRRRLATPIVVNFNHTPIATALSAIASAIGVNLVFHYHRQSTLDMPPNTPINLQITRGEPAKDVLYLLMRQAAITGAGRTIAWTYGKGAILVGSRPWIKSLKAVRTYNVAPLIMARWRGNIYHVSKVRLRRLVNLITGTIDRSSWVDNGGVSGQISRSGTCLVIRANLRDQRKIAAILRDLEAAAAEYRQRH